MHEIKCLTNRPGICEAWNCLDDKKVVEAVGSPASVELAGDKPLDTTSLPDGSYEVLEAKPVSSRKRDKDLNLEALETLVVTFGPREAARQAGLNSNTVRSLAARKGWKRADNAYSKTAPSHVTSSQSPNGGKHLRLHSPQKGKSLVQPVCNQSPARALSSVLSNLKAKSTLALATYSAKAAESALKHKKPLEISRKVKDVADIHKTLWPTEAESKNILQIGFIISGK